MASLHFRLAVLALLAVGCSDQEPTAPVRIPDRDPLTQPGPASSRPAPGGGVISALLVPIDPAELELISGSADLKAGTYRFRVLREPARVAGPGEVISGTRSGGGDFLRRIVTITRDTEGITYTTHRAYWHEVVRGGTYRMSGALPSLRQGNGATSDGLAAVTGDLPTATVSLAGINLCQLAADQLGQPLCGGSERTFVDKGVVELNGRVDSLYMVEGSVTISGDMDASYTVDPGGTLILNTGRRPVFSPCDQYPNVTGCFARVGALLQSFLASVGIDPAVLPPLKMCIPGTPITIQAGSVFPFRLPVIRICKITDWGEPPEFTPPFLGDATMVMRPTITSNLVMDVAGTGTLKLTIPVPGVSVVKCADHGNGFFCLKAGIVIVVQFHAVEAGGEVTLGYTDVERVTLSWSPQTEWVHKTENVSRDFSASFDPKNAADTISVKAGPAIVLEAELCFGPNASGCQDQGDGTSSGGGLIDLQLGVGGKVSLGRFFEGIWSRDAVFDNWHVGQETYLELELEGKLVLPRFLFRLDKNLKRSWSQKFLSQTLADTYGTGILQIGTVTTGALPDPDGYTVLVARKDTLPGILHGATHRLGTPNWADTMRFPIGVNQVRDLDGAPFCSVVYSDILLLGQQVGRRLGLGIPNYALEFGCQLLIADYEVKLSGVEDNCTVSGGPTQDVRLTQTKNNPLVSRTKLVTFEVDCPAPTVAPGSLQVSVTTDGFYLDPDGYEVLLDDMEHGPVAVNGTVTLDGLTPRAGRQVGLTGLTPTCKVTNGNPQSVGIASGGTAHVHFDVFCDPIVVEEVELSSLQVRTATSGPGSDPDGYQISLDGVAKGPIGTNGQIVLDGLVAGQHVVQLGGLAGNCSVVGGATKQIDVAGPSVLLDFSIQCQTVADAGPTGSVRVAVVTTGADLDPDGYRISIGAAQAGVGVNETVTVTGLTPGSASVSLEDLSPNCTVQNANPVTVPVPLNGTSDAAFAVHCDALAALEVTTSTTGQETDPDGYRIVLDGVDRGAIGANATLHIGELIAGAHAVSLSGIADNCGPTGDYPILPDLTAGASLPIRFSITCVARRDLGAVNIKIVGQAQKAGIRFQVLLDAVLRGETAADGGLLISPLLPGTHLIEIEGLPEGCRWAGKHPREARIIRGKTAVETFMFLCDKPGE